MRQSAEAARQLKVTRNTFLARIERILRYVDLENQDDPLYLQISLRLIQNHPFSRAQE